MVRNSSPTTSLSHSDKLTMNKPAFLWRTTNYTGRLDEFGGILLVVGKSRDVPTITDVIMSFGYSVSCAAHGAVASESCQQWIINVASWRIRRQAVVCIDILISGVRIVSRPGVAGAVV